MMTFYGQMRKKLKIRKVGKNLDHVNKIQLLQLRYKPDKYMCISFELKVHNFQLYEHIF